MNILITGTAGFIGFHLAKKMLQRGATVVGIDNINNYYDVSLKYARLNETGISRDAKKWHTPVKSSEFENYTFIRMNLEDQKELNKLFEAGKFDVVCNLAAQAGVRYSIENPHAYISSNVVGFMNILEACRNNKTSHLVYASSSSVYGNSSKMPLSVTNTVDNPVSLYAATKKSNELMAHTYSHLYNLPTTGLRFFTVYGPWGRPDMAPILFANAITNKKPIKVFNNGDLQRDFTYIDDIVDGLVKIIETSPETQTPEQSPYSIHNIGNGTPVKLMDFIATIENALGTKAEKELLPMQPGDVYKTFADVSSLKEKYNYKPNTSIKIGIKQFINWYNNYYKN
jgi:UDP-glucuronate 4-epimerase